MDLAGLEDGVAETMRFRCRETESLRRTRGRSQKDEEVAEKNLKTERQKKGPSRGREEANNEEECGKSSKEGSRQEQHSKLSRFPARCRKVNTRTVCFYDFSTNSVSRVRILNGNKSHLRRYEQNDID
jgi:hypothetical protein